MDVSYINHFIQSSANVFDTMLDCPLRRTSLSINPHAEAPHEVSAVIGLSGKVTGSVVLSLSTEVALKAAGQMLDLKFDHINADVIDGVGELANMVAGGAKAAMSHLDLSLGLPNVVVGRNQRIFFPCDVSPITVGFTTPWGSLSLQVGFDDTLDGDISSVARDNAAVAVT